MKKKVCLVSATPLSFHLFMKQHLNKFAEWADITIVYNPNYHKDVQPIQVSGRIKHIQIVRRISIFSDLIALGELIFFFKQEKFDAVVTLVPKAGLLGLLAGKLCGIKTRIHIFQGEVWFSKAGIIRGTLKVADKIVALMGSHLLSVSDSQSNFLVEQKICKHHELSMLCHGSISGVDTKRFSPSRRHRLEIREKYNISKDACMILFVGRIVKEKGLVELVEAFNILCSEHTDVMLMLVGPDDEGLASHLQNSVKLEHRHRLFFSGLSNSPEKFMAAADIFCLPSYREGFGMAALEASSCALPVVGTEIHGLSDAVIDGETGILVPVANYLELSNALATLIKSTKLRSVYGGAGRKRAIENFEHEKVIETYSDFFKLAIDNQKRAD